MTDPGPVEVAVHGMSLGSKITAAGVWTAVLGLVGIMWRSRVPMRRMKIAADEVLRDDLMSRVTKLEAQLEEERAVCQADLAVIRHRTNNVETCLDALLLLLEAAPEKAAEHVSKIRKMRADQRVAEAAEKGQLHHARVSAAIDAKSALDQPEKPA